MHEGDQLRREGRLDEAEVWYLRALQSFGERFGDAHPGLRFARHKLVTLYRSMGREEEAQSQLAVLRR